MNIVARLKKFREWLSKEQPEIPPIETAEKAYAMLEYDEGVRYKLYKDINGHWSVGVGRNVDAKGFSEQDIYVMLEEDVREAWNSAIKILGKEFFLSLSEPRKLAIVNMVFQLGEAGFAAFHDTIKAIKEGRWNDAAGHGADSLWAFQVPHRAKRVLAMLSQDVIPEEYNIRL